MPGGHSFSRTPPPPPGDVLSLSRYSLYPSVCNALFHHSFSINQRWYHSRCFARLLTWPSSPPWLLGSREGGFISFPRSNKKKTKKERNQSKASTDSDDDSLNLANFACMVNSYRIGPVNATPRRSRINRSQSSPLVRTYPTSTDIARRAVARSGKQCQAQGYRVWYVRIIAIQATLQGYYRRLWWSMPDYASRALVHESSSIRTSRTHYCWTTLTSPGMS